MTLDPARLRDATSALREANLAFARRYPGERGTPQPVHTLIEGAQHFTSDVARRRGAQALAALDEYAPDTETFGRVFGIGANPLLATIERRVRDKLAREPVEDYRIDFEDGFGVRSDAEEDTHVAEVASEIARGLNDRTLPPSLGIRIKPLTEELRERSIRTLDLLMTAVVKANALPPRFTITVPKVTVVAQVAYLVAVLRSLERELGLDDGALTFDVMIEVPQAILDMTGTSLLPRLIDAGDGRLRGIDFGTYDYTAGLSITASQQRLRHPACDFAKQMIQVAFAGTGIRVADGSTALLPVPIHQTPSNDDERGANAASVHAGWLIHYADVRHSLAGGFYQGWDLHAAQLVSRYAAVSSFYLEGVELAGARLETFLTKATNASLVGGMMDEPATGQGLLGFFLRGIAAGAITEDEAMALTSLTAEELRERSIIAIMRRRGVTVASYAIER
jgi:citrate lyase beta subunit